MQKWCTLNRGCTSWQRHCNFKSTSQPLVCLVSRWLLSPQTHLCGTEEQYQKCWRATNTASAQNIRAQCEFRKATLNPQTCNLQFLVSKNHTHIRKSRIRTLTWEMFGRRNKLHGENCKRPCRKSNFVEVWERSHRLSEDVQRRVAFYAPTPSSSIVWHIPTQCPWWYNIVSPCQSQE